MGNHTNLKIGGAPAKDHPRRCQAKFKRDPEKWCKKWALKGSRYCNRHFGRATKDANFTVRLDWCPVFYAKVLSKTLREAVEEQLGKPRQKQLEMLEELAMFRQAALDAVKLYSDVSELPDNTERRVERQAIATSIMHDALKEVANHICKIERNDAFKKDNISMHSVQTVVNQMVRLMYDVCGTEHMPLAKRLDAAMQEELKLVEDRPGTHLTPDMDAADMDDTVPDA